jgi:hypothetical protein
LAFAEITEKEVRPVGRDTLDPILFLLSSHDTEVQRAASAALGNLAVNSKLPLSSCILKLIFRSGQQVTDCQTRWTRAFDSANAQSKRRSAMQCRGLRDESSYSR